MIADSKIENEKIDELKLAAQKLNGRMIRTSGDGLWSRKSKNVRVKRAEIWEELGVVGLNVYFDRRFWDVAKDGLIYTDRRWIREIRAALRDAGFTRSSIVNYTEQGMQGTDHVNLIVGRW
jgi:hypothetical protein